MPANIFDFKAASYIYRVGHPVHIKCLNKNISLTSVLPPGLADLLKIISFLGQYCIVKEDIDIFWTFVKN